MNDTEQLFIAAAVWALIVGVVARRIPNWPGRIAFFAVAVGLPFWELPYGYYNFRSLCQEQGRLQVFEKILPQDTVCVGDFDAGIYSGLIRAGFARIEVTGRSDDPKRDASSGRVFQISRQNIKSSYCLSYLANNLLPWRVLRNDSLIVRASDDKVVARQSQFQWAGMWWQQQARPFLGRGGLCYEDPNQPSVVLRGGSQLK